MNKRKITKYFLLFLAGSFILILVVTGITIARTFNRTVIQFDIQQNQEIIYLSTYAEPPQFAIWIENLETNQLQTVFVTYRVSSGDWEGISVIRPKPMLINRHWIENNK